MGQGLFPPRLVSGGDEVFVLAFRVVREVYCTVPTCYIVGDVEPRPCVDVLALAECLVFVFDAEVRCETDGYAEKSLNKSERANLRFLEEHLNFEK